MPFIPHTPESLIPRSDSKNAASTCKGITSGGRPCRRALNTRKPKDGVLAVIANQNADDEGAGAFFCWQHRDQAAAFVSNSPSRGTGHLYPLQERTSTDTLAERLGLLEVEEPRGQRRPRKKKTIPRTAQKEGLPQQWQDIPGPLLAVSTSEKPIRQQAPRQKRPHPLLSFLCCGTSEDVSARRDTPAKPHREPIATSSTSHRPHASLPSDVRQTPKSNHSRADRKSSSARPPLAEKPSNPVNRPHLPKHQASQTEDLLALIPKSLSPQTTSQLLAELAKPVSEHDEEGYIYMFWLKSTTDPPSAAADPSVLLTPSPMPSPRHRRASAGLPDSSATLTPSPTTPSPRHRRASAGPQASSSSTQHASTTILLKIGRASNVQRRMNEWTRQCGYNLSLIRFYPYVPSSSTHNSPTPRASSAPQTSPLSPRKVPHAHKVERLIHLELAERRVRRDCETCGKEHREWFEVGGDRRGVKAVDEVIRRWVGWAEMR
ncbi:MAG: hypothetical protein LQ346_003791 [Caloplaca aetnensis]|nr:MAG: hypothetical protein LQ346_003791 [Caloplaca aetnensis]